MAHYYGGGGLHQSSSGSNLYHGPGHMLPMVMPAAPTPLQPSYYYPPSMSSGTHEPQPVSGVHSVAPSIAGGHSVVQTFPGGHTGPPPMTGGYTGPPLMTGGFTGHPSMTGGHTGSLPMVVRAGEPQPKTSHPPFPSLGQASSVGASIVGYMPYQSSVHAPCPPLDARLPEDFADHMKPRMTQCAPQYLQPQPSYPTNKPHAKVGFMYPTSSPVRLPAPPLSDLEKKQLTEQLHLKFGRVIGEHGPMEVTDEQILSLFIKLSSDERKLVMSAGSIKGFLAQSDNLTVQDNTVSVCSSNPGCLLKGRTSTNDSHYFVGYSGGYQTEPTSCDSSFNQMVEMVDTSQVEEGSFEARASHHGIVISRPSQQSTSQNDSRISEGDFLSPPSELDSSHFSEDSCEFEERSAFWENEKESPVPPSSDDSTWFWHHSDNTVSPTDMTDMYPAVNPHQSGSKAECSPKNNYYDRKIWKEEKENELLNVKLCLVETTDAVDTGHGTEGIEEACPRTDSHQRETTEEAGPRTTTLKRETTEEAGPRTASGQRETTEEAGPMTDMHHRETIEEAGPRTASGQRETTEEAGPRTASGQRETTEEAGPKTNMHQRETTEKAGPETHSQQRETTEEVSPRTDTHQREAPEDELLNVDLSLSAMVSHLQQTIFTTTDAVRSLACELVLQAMLGAVSELSRETQASVSTLPECHLQTENCKEEKGKEGSLNPNSPVFVPSTRSPLNPLSKEFYPSSPQSPSHMLNPSYKEFQPSSPNTVSHMFNPASMEFSPSSPGTESPSHIPVNITSPSELSLSQRINIFKQKSEMPLSPRVQPWPSPLAVTPRTNLILNPQCLTPQTPRPILTINSTLSYKSLTSCSGTQTPSTEVNEVATNTCQRKQLERGVQLDSLKQGEVAVNTEESMANDTDDVFKSRCVATDDRATNTCHREFTDSEVHTRITGRELLKDKSTMTVSDTLVESSLYMELLSQAKQAELQVLDLKYEQAKAVLDHLMEQIKERFGKWMKSNVSPRHKELIQEDYDKIKDQIDDAQSEIFVMCQLKTAKLEEGARLSDLKELTVDFPAIPNRLSREPAPEQLTGCMDPHPSPKTCPEAAQEPANLSPSLMSQAQTGLREVTAPLTSPQPSTKAGKPCTTLTKNPPPPGLEHLKELIDAPDNIQLPGSVPGQLAMGCQQPLTVTSMSVVQAVPSEVSGIQLAPTKVPGSQPAPTSVPGSQPAPTPVPISQPAPTPVPSFQPAPLCSDDQVTEPVSQVAQPGPRNALVPPQAGPAFQTPAISPEQQVLYQGPLLQHMIVSLLQTMPNLAGNPELLHMTAIRHLMAMQQLQGQAQTAYQYAQPHATVPPGAQPGTYCSQDMSQNTAPIPAANITGSDSQSTTRNREHITPSSQSLDLTELVSITDMTSSNLNIPGTLPDASLKEDGTAKRGGCEQPSVPVKQQKTVSATSQKIEKKKKKKKKKEKEKTSASKVSSGATSPAMEMKEFKPSLEVKGFNFGSIDLAFCGKGHSAPSATSGTGHSTTPATSGTNHSGPTTLEAEHSTCSHNLSRIEDKLFNLSQSATNEVTLKGNRATKQSHLEECFQATSEYSSPPRTTQAKETDHFSITAVHRQFIQKTKALGSLVNNLNSPPVGKAPKGLLTPTETEQLTAGLDKENTKPENAVTEKDVPKWINAVTGFSKLTARTAIQPSKMASTQPSNVTSSQPSIVTSSQPSKATSSKPFKLTTSQSTKVTSSLQSKVTSSQPSKVTASQPLKVTSSQPSKVTSSQSLKVTSSQPSKVTSSLQSEVTSSQPFKVMFNQPSKVTSSQTSSATFSCHPAMVPSQPSKVISRSQQCMVTPSQPTKATASWPQNRRTRQLVNVTSSWSTQVASSQTSNTTRSQPPQLTSSQPPKSISSQRSGALCTKSHVLDMLSNIPGRATTTTLKPKVAGQGDILDLSRPPRQAFPCTLSGRPFLSEKAPPLSSEAFPSLSSRPVPGISTAPISLIRAPKLDFKAAAASLKVEKKSVPEAVKSASLNTLGKTLGRHHVAAGNVYKSNSASGLEDFSKKGETTQTEEEENDLWQQVGKKKVKKPEFVPVVTTSSPSSTSSSISEASTKKNNFERLVSKLMEAFPDKSRMDVLEMVGMVREKRGGLKGISLTQILADVGEICSYYKTVGKSTKPKAVTSVNTGCMSGTKTKMVTPDVKCHVWKTQICTFWLEGSCGKGDECVYAHGKHQLRKGPKNILCQNLVLKGKCTYGDTCIFAHSTADMKNYEAAEKLKTQSCKKQFPAGMTILSSLSTVSSAMPPSAPKPPVCSNPWGDPTAEASSQNQFGYDSDEDGVICAICTDRVRDGYGQVLDCSHVFHRQCIDQWVIGQGERTCPSCRSLVLLPDQFPKLGQ